MQREAIREKLGQLEEQIELLQVNAFSKNFSSEPGLAERISDTFSGLQLLVNEETLKQKSISSIEFVNRISKVFITEANKQGLTIALSHSGGGNISLELVELSMNAILSCMRAALKKFSPHETTERIRRGLFSTISFNFKVLANSNEIYFSLIDDGSGYENNVRDEIETHKHFQKIRAHLVNFGGWFQWENFKDYGSQIEFKIPLQKSRFESVLVNAGSTEVLVPKISISGQTNEMESIQASKIPLISIDGKKGIQEIKAQKTEEPFTAIKMTIADIQVWIYCKKVFHTVMCRKLKIDEFIDEHAWYNHIGVFQENINGVVRPLLTGDILMNYFANREKVNETN